MTDLTSLNWRLIPEEARPGSVQMALEEVAAETVAKGGPATVRVFRWEPSTLSLGYRQTPDTVDWTYCDREDIDVTRRQTGGGGIYHDHVGDISYSIVAPASSVPGDLMDSYEHLCTPLFEALDELGVEAEFAGEARPALYEPSCYLRDINPAHDVVVAGRKLSGNAQYRQREAVIQHGSVSYAETVDHHLGVFADPAVSPEEFRERVTSISELADVDRTAAVTAFEETFRQWTGAQEGAWTTDELAAARELADHKYASTDWVQHRTEPVQ